MDTPLAAYLAPEGYLDPLLEELGGSVSSVHERLVLTREPARPAAWAANIWLEPERIAVASIGEAAKALRARQRNWAGYAFHRHRRQALIAAKLPKVSAKPLVFPAPAPQAPLGSWTLLDDTTLLASARCTSPFANGEVRFVENREAPPNRAYLKLWEALTLIGRRPGPGQTCLDLGASPGGWSWVLAELGAKVIAVDKAPLDPKVAGRTNVETRRESAFALDPAALGPIDWLFSDVVCYPERLFTLIERWRMAGTVRHFVCTLKFQGATDHATAARFAAIPGSRLLHLHHNKHELTWIHPGLP
jgi:23S rRNA (cytidine2498-2'-O)-methyltransferase